MIEPRILYENNDVVVYDKPAGLLVHPAPNTHEPTLVDIARAHAPCIDGVGESAERPGIMHRLDRDVSGIVAIAKTEAMYQHLKQQFIDRTVEKDYLALVYGQLPNDHDVITLKIARSKDGSWVARPESQEGREAHTEYDVIERYKTATYCRIKILTGRTHQIRVHMRAVDHPIVGDTLYAKKRMKNIRTIPLDRLFLHATRFTFALLDGTRTTVESPLPEELARVLEPLRKQ